jgi:hypothetical protein
MSDTFFSVSGLTIVACAWTGPLLTDVGAATADVPVRTVAVSATLRRTLFIRIPHWFETKLSRLADSPRSPVEPQLTLLAYGFPQSLG